MEEPVKDPDSPLTPLQRQHIEELVELSPPVIKAGVRRDAVSAAEVLHTYSGVRNNQGTMKFELKPCEDNGEPEA